MPDTLETGAMFRSDDVIGGRNDKYIIHIAEDERPCLLFTVTLIATCKQ